MVGISENLPDGVEVPVVEDEQELVLVFEALHRVRGALGEVPDIADLELGNLELPVLVDGRNQDRAGVYIAPFSLCRGVSAQWFRRELG